MNPEKENLYERFKEKLTAVSGECYRVKSPADAGELVKKLFADKGVKSVALYDSAIAGAADIPGVLGKAGVAVYQESYREMTPIVDAGITQVKWAIAELGTLVQDGTDVDDRLCSTLPPLHVALVNTSCLIPTLMETLEEIHRLPQIPGFVGFITGPSRTSDIERVLTIGVHGPLQLIAIFVDQESGGVN